MIVVVGYSFCDKVVGGREEGRERREGGEGGKYG